MYRILPIEKDTYITNKIVSAQPCTGSNVGLAGTVDLFKIYKEEAYPLTGSTTELSRALVKASYTSLSQELLTASGFSCFLHMKDVYGGQPTPSNFTLVAMPLSNSFLEGRGSDVVSYQELDVANWVSGSLNSGWVEDGAAATGSLGDAVDTLTDYMTSQSFVSGGEDLWMDVTSHVSASLIGDIVNHGFRISFSPELEEDQYTYFVKRFGSTQAYNKHLRPKLVVKYDDVHADDSGDPQYNVEQTFWLYMSNGLNFVSSSTVLTGSDCATLRLTTSKSYTYLTTSWSQSHSASIEHLTKSVVFWSMSASVSQVETGVYRADTVTVSTADQDLSDFLVTGSFAFGDNIPFQLDWVSNDGTVVIAREWLDFRNGQPGVATSLQENDLVVSLPNLASVYRKGSVSPVRLRVAIYNQAKEQDAYRLPGKTPLEVCRMSQWQIKEAYTRKVVIPFDEIATRLSYDGNGMFFDFYPSDLDNNTVYQIDLLVKEHPLSQEIFIENDGFKFKVVDQS